jgi:hypothetical protein
MEKRQMSNTHTSPGPEAAYDRAYLKKFTDLYFNALKKNDPSALPVSDNLIYTENLADIKLGKGLWKAKLEEKFRMEIFDPETSGAAVEAVFKEDEQWIMFFLRLKIRDNNITEIETLVTREGEAIVWNPGNLTELSPNFTRSIRPAERDSRYALMAVADGYWRAMETEGTADYVKPAILPDTERYENGLHTTNEPFPEMLSIPADKRPPDMPVFPPPVYPFKDNGPRTALQDFDHGVWRGTRVYDRRYPVVDEERGIVLSIARFGSLKEDLSNNPNAPPAPFVAEFFAVTCGKIREVHVVIRNISPAILCIWE